MNTPTGALSEVFEVHAEEPLEVLVENMTFEGAGQTVVIDEVRPARTYQLEDAEPGFVTNVWGS